MSSNRRKYIAWTRAGLLVLLGCVPATILCYYTLPLAISGLFGFVFGDGWLSLVMGVWGVAGVVGTLSLWAVSLGFPTPLRCAGLIIGIAANLMMPAIFPRSYASLWFSGDWIVLFAPSIVAVYLLAELIYSAYRLGEKKRASTTT